MNEKSGLVYKQVRFFRLPPMIKLVGTLSEALGMTWIPPGACIIVGGIFKILLIWNLFCNETYKAGLRRCIKTLGRKVAFLLLCGPPCSRTFYYLLIRIYRRLPQAVGITEYTAERFIRMC